MSHVKIQQFEGPLDLLLSLIEQQQLNITEISLAEVTEQFLAYVKELEKIDATQLADYLGIAAKLLVIKSKAILPSLEVEADEEEQEEDLASKLLRYKQFKEAAKYFKQLDARGLQSFTRTRVFSERINFWPDPAVDAPALRQSIAKVLDSLRELDNLPKAKIREAISIQEKIQGLQAQLSGQIETKLSELIGSAKNKEEVIITFLALLELIKQRIFTVSQSDLFSDVTITKFRPTEVEMVVEEIAVVDEESGDDEIEEEDEEEDDEEDEEEDEDEEQ